MVKIRVVELFAGVGGFRIGLEGYPKKSTGTYVVVWSNQWEPSTKMQHANLVYKNRFGAENHCGEDIASVATKDIPDHDLLVGGFPCQDYSVATTLKRSGGLIGKKGVLWWQIHRIIKEKKEKKPRYLLLENVDRLLKSPSKQRGRDFAIMLSSLSKLGYAVEWKVINAAEYGMPQRRKRIFIVAYHKSTPLYKRLEATADKKKWVFEDSVTGKAFFSKQKDGIVNTGDLSGDLVKISEAFNTGSKTSPFLNCGVMLQGHFWTYNYTPKYTGQKVVLADILVDEAQVPSEFYIHTADLARWEYLKGAKSEERYNAANDFKYKYTEGAMTFPDDIKKPSRTIITGEGGRSPSRFKHVVKTPGGLRRLTPIELERLNMFPDDHTKLDKITDSKRAFFMGNALVVGVVEKLGKVLANEIAFRDK
ncbi:MAG: DNA (cytosine-5-)-methyltransferase [Cytophagaceae bacterium]|nr:DNA (cytosine-5-)-methyltransferase [Cytophagaceae bacterium]